MLSIEPSTMMLKGLVIANKHQLIIGLGGGVFPQPHDTGIRHASSCQLEQIAIDIIIGNLALRFRQRLDRFQDRSLISAFRWFLKRWAVILEIIIRIGVNPNIHRLSMRSNCQVVIFALKDLVKPLRHSRFSIWVLMPTARNWAAIISPRRA